MSKNKKQKPGNKSAATKADLKSNTVIKAFKGGREVSQAPPKPQKPIKGNQ